MLGKLMKYELKATARNFLPLYVAIIIASTFLSISIALEWDINNEYVGMISVLVFMGLFIALAVMTLLTIIKGFYNNVLGDQGYLMFTLPVKSGSIVLSKWLVSILWFVCSCIVTAIAGFIIITGVTGGEIVSFLLNTELWNEFVSMYGWNAVAQMVSVWFNMALTAVVGFAYFVMQCYLAMSIGQLPIFSKYRMPASFIAYFVVDGVLKTGILTLGLLGVETFLMPLMEQIEFMITNSVMGMNVIFMGVSVGYLLISLIMFTITNIILKKQLNLQ